MPKYLEQEALVQRLKNSPLFTNFGEDGYFIRNGVIDIIKKQQEPKQTADVVEVRHGEWIDSGDGDWRCTNCNEYFRIDIDLHPIDDCDMYYCPKCGAKMDGKGEGE